MAGIRLHHPELRNCVYTLIHEGRPLKRVVPCGLCGFKHYHKTYHLTLDGMGDVVVSETVYERIKEAGLDELKVLSEVQNPDPQVVDTNSVPEKQIIVSREGRKNG